MPQVRFHRPLLFALISLAGLSVPVRATPVAGFANPHGDAFAESRDTSDFGAVLDANWHTSEQTFTLAAIGEAREQESVPDPAAFTAEVAALPPDETPSEARVPEPATLVLLGTGLIIISRASRAKWQRRHPLTRRLVPELG